MFVTLSTPNNATDAYIISEAISGASVLRIVQAIAINNTTPNPKTPHTLLLLKSPLFA